MAELGTKQLVNSDRDLIYPKTNTDSVFLSKDGDTTDSSLTGYIDRTDKTIEYFTETIEKATNCIKIRYGDLSKLVADESLVQGTWYRIIDYKCTTTQQYTQSAGHQFDILVRADDKNRLNENAFAAHHEDDEYFNKSRLEVWQLKYSLQNDTSRFVWADAKNGKGVVYWMKDEFGNECPYDFKNIQFSRLDCSEDSNEDRTSLKGRYVCPASGMFPGDLTSGKTEIYAYTFSSDETGKSSQTDLSLSRVSNVFLNTLRPAYSSDETGRLVLNDVVFYNIGNFCNTLDSSCTENTLISCNCISLCSGCRGNVFGYLCKSDTFGDGLIQNSFGSSCADMVFGDNCSYNSFGDGCNCISFGHQCEGNIFGDNCTSISFGNSAQYNSVLGGCGNDRFGDGCTDNTLQQSCSFNTMQNGCHLNTLSEGSQCNSFGNYCDNINVSSLDGTLTNCSFGNRCSNILFDGTGDFKNITVFDGVSYCKLPVSSNDIIVNAQILSGEYGSNYSNMSIIQFSDKKYVKIAGYDTENVLKIVPAINL